MHLQVQLQRRVRALYGPSPGAVALHERLVAQLARLVAEIAARIKPERGVIDVIEPVAHCYCVPLDAEPPPRRLLVVPLVAAPNAPSCSLLI